MTDWTRLADQCRRRSRGSAVNWAGSPVTPRWERCGSSARRHGVFLRPRGETIVLMPPLSVTEDQIVVLIDGIGHGILEVCA